MITTDEVLYAYTQGFFPMGDDKTGEIFWSSAEMRAIIPLDERFHIPHGLKRTLKKQPFTIRINQNFDAVIRACAQKRGDDPENGIWITPSIISLYTKLHEDGWAHSIECYNKQNELVGGLYGIWIDRAFFGESMFHKETDASKVALVALVHFLRSNGVILLDAQWQTPHLAQFGTYEISHNEYLKLLKEAIAGISSES